MIQNCTFRAVRLFVWLWMKTKQHCNCFRPQKGYIVITEDSDNAPVTVHKILRTRENGTVDEKYKIEWDDRDNDTKIDAIFEHVMPPWLMITKNGEDYTEKLHSYIAKGNEIRLHFLNWRFGHGNWEILDTKTFEEIKFPSTGIIIK
jgi:hypothetical protein